MRNPDAAWAAMHQLTAGLKASLHQVNPFHWEIEFPEVFGAGLNTASDRVNNPGFDAVVGNPPFLGGSAISHRLGMLYFSHLRTAFAPAGHHCDLVGYFFRRSYNLLRSGGCLGLIATNTIAQGDSRVGTLVPILDDHGVITSCRKRLKWPGEAAVTVSQIHILKGAECQNVLLNGVETDRISAFLIAGEQDNSPERLVSNPYFSVGMKIYGQGFLFDDEDEDASSTSQMRRILLENPDLADRVKPYIGGEDINNKPNATTSRYAIYLSDLDEESALEQVKPLANIVRQKVLPNRMKLGSNPNNTQLKRKWWAYQAHRPRLQSEILELSKALMISGVTSHLAFTFVPSSFIPSHKLVVIASEKYSVFCCLQSRVHEVWVRMFTSTFEDRLNYSPSDCYENFPLPTAFGSVNLLETCGSHYFMERAALMGHWNEGLTKIYNRFHDVRDETPGVEGLRCLHQAMDRAVLQSYGWNDLAESATPMFLDQDAEGEHCYQNRFFWPAPFRDEVLARLLKLNAERAADERARGLIPLAAEVDELEDA